jgi:hypothetical protein
LHHKDIKNGFSFYNTRWGHQDRQQNLLLLYTLCSQYLTKNFKLLYLTIRIKDFAELSIERYLCITRISKKLSAFPIQGGVTKIGNKTYIFEHFVLIVLYKNFKLLYLMIRIEEFVEH